MFTYNRQDANQDAFYVNNSKKSIANSVQRAIQLEEFRDDSTVGHAVAGWTRVRNWFNDLKLDQKIDVGSHGLTGDASVLGKLGLVELAARREIKQRVDEDGDALMLSEVQLSAWVVQTRFFGIDLLG